MIGGGRGGEEENGGPLNKEIVNKKSPVLWARKFGKLFF